MRVMTLGVERDDTFAQCSVLPLTIRELAADVVTQEKHGISILVRDDENALVLEGDKLTAFLAMHTFYNID